MKVLILLLYLIINLLLHIGTKTRIIFDGNCLKEDKITFTYGIYIIYTHMINIYFVYETNLYDRGYDNYQVLKNSLFGAFKLVKDANIDKYKYSWCRIGIDGRGTFSVGNEFGRNVMWVWVFLYMWVFLYILIKRKKDILILGEGPTQGLDDVTLIAEKKSIQ